MNKAKLIRLTSITLTLIMTIGLWGCGKTEAYRQAGLVLSTIKSSIPIIKPLAPGIATKLETLVPIAEKLKQGLSDASNATSSIYYLRDLLPVFNDIVEHDIPALDLDTQKRILVALAVADISLNFLAEFYEQAALPTMRMMGRAPKSGSDVISQFARKPVWGHLHNVTK